MAENVKAWRCRHCGAAMGMVRVNGSGVMQLLLFRKAIPLGRGIEPLVADAFPGVEVLAVVDLADVKCSECEEVRTFVPSPEAVRRLVKQYRK